MNFHRAARCDVVDDSVSGASVLRPSGFFLETPNDRQLAYKRDICPQRGLCGRDARALLRAALAN